MSVKYIANEDCIFEKKYYNKDDPYEGSATELPDLFKEVTVEEPKETNKKRTIKKKTTKKTETEETKEGEEK